MTYARGGGEALALPGITATMLDRGAVVEPRSTLSTFDLIWTIDDDADGLTVALRYKSGMQASTARQWLASVQDACAQLCAVPHARWLDDQRIRL